jgi:phosphatidylglycerol:prolipoprotein diacylglycerol transferase
LGAAALSFQPSQLVENLAWRNEFPWGISRNCGSSLSLLPQKNLNFWEVTDLVSAPAMLALGFGRIANFINGELVGRVWNGAWCVVFPDVDAQCRHPSILYAAAYRFIIFGELLWLSLKSFRSQFKPGFIFWNFVLLEGIGRFIVDFYREDALTLGLSLGQWFSVVMVIIAAVFLWKRHKGDFRGLFV